MYINDHNPAHFHVIYNEFEASINFQGKILEGKLPIKTHKIVRLWVELNKDKLMFNWLRVSQEKAPLWI
jgi:hypothetical protein